MELNFLGLISEILSLEKQWKNNVLQFGAHTQNSFEVIEPLLALRGVLLTIFQRQVILFFTPTPTELKENNVWLFENHNNNLKLL
jgi:hypothetical protein